MPADAQLALFHGPGSDRGALDDLFARTGTYRRSGPYRRLLDAIGRFVDYSAYNAALVHIQNPKASRVATAEKWRKDFGRQPTQWARPLVLLRPFGPVKFVFDAAETEPVDSTVDPLAEWNRGMHVETDLTRLQSEGLLVALQTSCDREGVGVVDNEALSFDRGGSIRPVQNAERAGLPHRLASAEYLVEVNADYHPAQKVATLAHELGHLFCGHLPKTAPSLWWESRHSSTGNGLHRDLEEFEAESEAYLVCRRFGLKTASEAYLAGYADDDAALPEFSFDAVIRAVQYVEGMKVAAFKPKRRDPPRPEAVPPFTPRLR